MLLKEVPNVCSTISKLPANRGRFRSGYTLVHRLKGFACWIKDRQRHSQVARQVADDNWDLQHCKNSTGYIDMEDARADDSSKIKPPGKLREGNWV